MDGVDGPTEDVPRCSRYWARPMGEGVPDVKAEASGCEEGASGETEAREARKKSLGEEETWLPGEEAQY
jgi:hypothetical protein